MKILYYFKPFDTKIVIRQVDFFLFLLAISSKYNFFHLFLIAVVNLVRNSCYVSTVIRSFCTIL